jgi:hypothetical protein
MRHLLFAFGALILACADAEKTNSTAKKPSFEEIKTATKTPEKPALERKVEAMPKVMDHCIILSWQKRLHLLILLFWLIPQKVDFLLRFIVIGHQMVRITSILW